jgi:hypothetical protein
LRSGFSPGAAEHRQEKTHAASELRCLPMALYCPFEPRPRHVPSPETAREKLDDVLIPEKGSRDLNQINGTETRCLLRVHSRRVSDVLGMSASPPTPAVLPHCREPTRCAISGCEQPQQIPSYSITSSARASRAGGTSMPSALAVRRFIRNSNFVGPSTGIKLGLVPFSIFSTYRAARRHTATWSVP